MLQKHLPPQSGRHQTYLEPGTWTSAASGLGEPPAHTHCHAGIMHSRLLLLPPLRTASSNSPPSSDSCCLRAALEIKGGGMAEDNVFQTSAIAPVLMWLRHSQTRAALFNYWRQQLNRFCSEGNRFGVQDSGPGHAAHHSYAVLGRGTQFPPLNQAF